MALTRKRWSPQHLHLFTLYTGPIEQIVRQHRLDFHLFSDDSQLYVSFKIKDTSDEMAALARIQACMGDQGHHLRSRTPMMRWLHWHASKHVLEN